MIKLVNILKEMLLYTDYEDESEISVYKNPKSITRMTDNFRAISDKEGNLYIADDGGLVFIHAFFYEELKRKNFIPNFGSWDTAYENLDVIGWQHLKNNIFWCGEKYPEEKKDEITKMVKNCKKMNPQYKFVFKIKNKEFKI